MKWNEWIVVQMDKETDMPVNEVIETKMTTIEMFPLVGAFAENKDLARKVRVEEIVPSLERGVEVTLDFHSVDSATQSFIHALISDLIRKYGVEVLDRLYFKDCTEIIRKIVTIVADYMQEGI